jgi:hypothetical protein
MVGMTGDAFYFAQQCLSAGTVDQCLAGTVFPDEDGNLTPVDTSREVLEFLDLARSSPLRLTFAPPGVDSSFGRFVSNAQFPSAGTLVASDSEVILQFVELPIEPP